MISQAFLTLGSFSIGLFQPRLSALGFKPWDFSLGTSALGCQPWAFSLVFLALLFKNLWLQQFHFFLASGLFSPRLSDLGFQTWAFSLGLLAMGFQPWALLALGFQLWTFSFGLLASGFLASFFQLRAFVPRAFSLRLLASGFQPWTFSLKLLAQGSALQHLEQHRGKSGGGNGYLSMCAQAFQERTKPGFATNRENRNGQNQVSSELENGQNQVSPTNHAQERTKPTFGHCFSKHWC